MTKARDLSLAAKAPIASPVFTGNVGVGVTPESWLSTYPAVQIGAAGCVIGSNDNSFVSLNGNAYVDSVNSRWEYVNSDFASQYQQYDGNHNWRVAASGTADAAISWNDAMTINNAGIVTKPLQPAFGANATYTNIPLSPHVVVNLSERFDVGSNLTSNTFTAPVTGKYLMTYHVYFTQLDSDHNALGIQISTSNKPYEAWWQPNKMLSSDGIFSVSGSQICDMDINDTMQYKVYTSGGTQQTDIHGDSTVSGCLIC